MLIPCDSIAAGVLAIDTKSQSVAFAYDYKTEIAAITEIKSSCMTCDTIRAFKKGCSAMAKGRGAFGWGVSVSFALADAKARAISECVKFGGIGCEVVVWACSK